MTSLPFQPLIDRVLAWVLEPARDAAFHEAKAEFFRHTGEVDDTARSFESRMQCFLDWILHDRPIDAQGRTPLQVWAEDPLLDGDTRAAYRRLSRSVLGLFEVLGPVQGAVVQVVNRVTEATYEVVCDPPLAGVTGEDLFEARLVPWWDGQRARWAFSGAFLFHPRSARGRILEGLETLRDACPAPSPRECVWMVARMTTRAERARSMSIEALYDFRRPPPVLSTGPMRFDPASVAERRARLRPAAGVHSGSDADRIESPDDRE